MGYNSSIIIVNKLNAEITLADGRKRGLTQNIMQYDLCKDYEFSNQLYKYPASNLSFVWGDRLVADEDAAGYPIREMSISDAICELRRAEQAEHYRRRPPLIAALEAFDPSEFDDLVVLHYGS